MKHPSRAEYFRVYDDRDIQLDDEAVAREDDLTEHPERSENAVGLSQLFSA